MRIVVRFWMSTSLLALATSSFAVGPPIFDLEWGGHGTALGFLDQPTGVATNAAGQVYVTEIANNRVQRFESDGTLPHAWGTPGMGAGQFTQPYDVAVDPSGDVYVIDHANRVQKFDEDGVFILQWGSTGSGPGQFDLPLGIATDAAGNVYVCEGGGSNQRVQKFDGTGTFLLQFGSSGSGNGQFSQARDMAIAANGDIYVADGLNHRVQRFDSAGNYLSQWGVYGSGDGQFDQPLGIDIDASGFVYVVDYGTNLGNTRAQIFAPNGGFVTSWATSTHGFSIALSPTEIAYISFDHPVDLVRRYRPEPVAVEAPLDYLGAWSSGNGALSNPWGVDDDSDGNLYLVDGNNHRVLKFDEDGNFLFGWGGMGNAPEQFDGPTGLYVNASDEVFVADSNHHRVKKFTADGELVWSSPGATFNTPTGIGGDSGGNLYVADQENHRVQKLDANGVFVLSWGSNGSGPGNFDFPRGVAVDASDDVYVVDQGNHRIQKFDSSGSFILQWGGNGSGYGQLNQPQDVEVDANGDVYVSDPGNFRIQKFDSSGSFLAAWGSAGVGNGQFTYALGLGVNAKGELYATDRDGPVHRIQKWGRVPSVIASVLDVGGDQGRQVRINFSRSGRDFFASASPVTQYEVFRRIEASLVFNVAAPGPDGRESGAERVEPVHGTQRSRPILRDDGWEFVGAVPAHGRPEYNIVAATLADSSMTGIPWSAFFVRATSSPSVFFDSAVDSGYSVDNVIPPIPPAPSVAENLDLGDVELAWSANPAPDFELFAVYRGETRDFVPESPRDRLAVTREPVWVDTQVAAGETWYYRIGAFDDSWNFSGYSPAVGIDVQTGIREEIPGAPARLELLQNAPNPFVAGTTIAFSLDRATPVTLRIYDARGALVREVLNEPRPPGRHEVTWHGRDGRDRSVASGMYLYELRTDRSRLVRKLVVKR